MKTLCVTGHRPAKLPWKYKKEGLEYDEYCESLSCYIDDCIRHGYTHFISGMALGVDMDFAETVLDFKAQYGFPILLECAMIARTMNSRIVSPLADIALSIKFFSFLFALNV